ncbi:unnamed protein product [Caenorhabditis sp. 36 PRJEB53466]|nr:unnamed protein product [Caenorhabditis sp. 36 PRJEB53466]
MLLKSLILKILFLLPHLSSFVSRNPEAVKIGIAVQNCANDGYPVHFSSKSVSNDVVVYKFGLPGNKTGEASVEDDNKLKAVKVSEKNQKEWAAIIENTRMECKRTDNDGCFTSHTITSQQEQKQFDALGCTELLGDLVIQYVSSTPKYAKSLEKVHGRLVIDGVAWKDDVSFEKLKAIGTFVVSMPTLQITNNKFASVAFKKLETITCAANKRQSCIVIGENHSKTSISIKSHVVNASAFFNDDVNMTPGAGGGKRARVVKNEEIKSERDLKAMNLTYTVHNWLKDTNPGNGKIYLGLGLTCLIAAAAAFLVSKYVMGKPNGEFDMENIDETDNEDVDSNASAK